MRRIAAVMLCLSLVLRSVVSLSQELDVVLLDQAQALVRAGEAERDRIVLEAEAKGERMKKDAQFLVEQELKQIRVDLQRETVEAAIAAAEELLKKRVTMADQERLAEDYLSDLGGKPARPSMAPKPGTQENAT